MCTTRLSFPLTHRGVECFSVNDSDRTVGFRRVSMEGEELSGEPHSPNEGAGGRSGIGGQGQGWGTVLCTSAVRIMFFCVL